jgi:hypothetical protein
MATQKQKFALFAKLAELGFTYEESAALRRIEMTLQRWAEAECGDSNEYASFSIERDEITGKPFRCVYPHMGKMRRHPIADREAGALRRLNAIVDARNAREEGTPFMAANAQDHIFAYHQGDCRGCMLYLVTRADLTINGVLQPIESFYNRGIAVCC